MYHYHSDEHFEEVKHEDIAKLLRSMGALGNLRGFDYIVFIIYRILQQPNETYWVTKQAYPEAVLVFIVTPSAAEMARRLIGRKTETHEQILNRFKRAVEEAEHMKKYDYIVVNDRLEDCVEELNGIVENNEGGIKYDPGFKSEFIEDLKEIIRQHVEEARSRMDGLADGKKQ